MAPESDKIIELLDARKFVEAETLLNNQIRQTPQDRELQTIAFQLYKSTNRHKKALDIAREIIHHNPKHWRGYALAARCLDEQQSTDEAIKVLQTGLKMQPKSRRLLTIARRLYKKAGDEKSKLKYSLKLAGLCPKKIDLQVETIHELARFGRIEKASKLLTKALSSSPDNKHLIQLEKKLNRYAISSQIQNNQQQIPPTIFLAGNCQIQPIGEWLKESFPFSEIKNLKPYHLIEHQSTIDDWLNGARNADIVLMIPVKEGFSGYNFGSDSVSKHCNPNSLFATYPSFHFEAFYPLFGYAKTNTGSTLRGKDLGHTVHTYDDYHDFLAMFLSQNSDDEISRLLDAMRLTDSDQYQGSSVVHSIAINSMLQFSKRYPDYADILQSNITTGMGHTFNHPDTQFLCKAYFKIWTQIFNFSPDDFIPYTKDPLNKLQLPIPSFVTRSLTSPRFEHPWMSASQIKERTSLESYINEIRRSVDFYRRHPSIANNNTDHPKMHLAKEFIAELNP